MKKISVIDRDGRENSVSAESGRSLMEIIRDSGCDELLALCGGCMSCATCHVYVEDRFSGAIPAISDEENELLDSSDCRQSNSRLSCQIMFNDDLDGMKVTIAPDE